MHELRYSYNASFLRDVFSQELDGVREAGVELSWMLVSLMTR